MFSHGFIVGLADIQQDTNSHQNLCRWDAMSFPCGFCVSESKTRTAACRAWGGCSVHGRLPLLINCSLRFWWKSVNGPKTASGTDRMVAQASFPWEDAPAEHMVRPAVCMSLTALWVSQFTSTNLVLSTKM